MKTMQTKYECVATIVEFVQAVKPFKVNSIAANESGLLTATMRSLPAELLYSLNGFPQPEITKLNTLEGELPEIRLAIQLISYDTDTLELIPLNLDEWCKAIVFCSDLFFRYGIV